MARTNVRATRTVLGLAAAARLDPVVHVSSAVALVRRGGSGPDLPLGDMTTAYGRSRSSRRPWPGSSRPRDGRSCASTPGPCSARTTPTAATRGS
ncbi:SDR family oxidoreductase [Ornithinimicrobium sp. CNJ-824]|uniref:SDR family oxidoreductase n=1 Tax=Ornithinimicrobium sp. CNJ-824 TaxID=1904966 RepID=UPI00192D1324